MDHRASSNPPAERGMPAGEITTFVELSGERAGDVLAAYGASVARAGDACELLASETQEDLFLLVCHGSRPAAEGREESGSERRLPALPAGAKTWAFRMIEVYR